MKRFYCEICLKEILNDAPLRLRITRKKPVYEREYISTVHVHSHCLSTEGLKVVT